MKKHALFVVAAVALVLTTTAHAELKAYWDFNGGSPTQLADKASTNHLTAQGGISTFSASTRATFGDVLDNGTDAKWLTAPSVLGGGTLGFIGTGDFSFSLWTRRTSRGQAKATTGYRASGLLDMDDTDGFQAQWQGTTGDGQQNFAIRFDRRLSSGNAVINASKLDYATQIENQWINIIVTADRTSGTARIYYDGVDVTEGTVPGNIAAITDISNTDFALMIGKLNADMYTNGQLDDVAFFDHVLTVGQIGEINANGGTPISATSMAVPEPVTMSILGLGTIGLLRRRRK